MAETLTMPHSNGSDIPEELFEHILWHACGRHLQPDREAKRLIAACALVCRYWARLSRRWLFHNITLRTLDDMQRFREIVDTPALRGLEPIAETVGSVYVAADSRNEPWLHLLFMLVIPELREAPFVSVEALPSGGKPWRSLHPSLPRAVPGSLMPVGELRLQDAHFPNGRTLARLLSSISLLRHLDAFNVTFGTTPSAADFFTPPFNRKMVSVASDDLQLCLWFMPFLIANTSPEESGTGGRAGRSAKATLNDDDLKLLCELLCIISGASNFDISKDESQSTSFRTRAFLVHAHLALIFSLVLQVSYFGKTDEWGSPPVAPVLQVHLASEGTRGSLQLAAAPAALPVALHVDTLVVNLREEISDDMPDICNEQFWARFAEKSLEFPHLRHVELLRGWGSESPDSARKPAFLGITDKGFESLIKAKKFVCRFVDYMDNTVHKQTDTVDRKVRENLAGGETGTGGGDTAGDGDVHGGADVRSQGGSGEVEFRAEDVRGEYYTLEWEPASPDIPRSADFETDAPVGQGGREESLGRTSERYVSADLNKPTFT